MTTHMTDRRTFLQATALATVAVGAATHLAAQQTPAAPASAVPAFTSKTELKPISFDPARLDGLSERLIRSHWEHNYGGSVRALAAVKQQLLAAQATPDTPAYIYNDLKREHLLRTGSVVLHEYYFDNLGGNGQAGADERQRIAASFGTFDAWETEFRR